MDFYSDIWVGYLAGLLLEKCADIAKANCDGCNAGLKLPLLHLHNQLSLLEKCNHGKSTDKIKPQCDVCNTSFKNKHSLATHKNKFHKEVTRDIDQISRPSSQVESFIINHLKQRKRTVSQDMIKD